MATIRQTIGWNSPEAVDWAVRMLPLFGRNAHFGVQGEGSAPAFWQIGADGVPEMRQYISEGEGGWPVVPYSLGGEGASGTTQDLQSFARDVMSRGGLSQAQFASLLNSQLLPNANAAVNPDGTISYDVDPYAGASDPGAPVMAALMAMVGGLAAAGAGLGAAGAAEGAGGLAAADAAAGLVPEFGTHAAYNAAIAAPVAPVAPVVEAAQFIAPPPVAPAAPVVPAVPAEIPLQSLNAIDAAAGMVPELGTQAAYNAAIAPNVVPAVTESLAAADAAAGLAPEFGTNAAYNAAAPVAEVPWGVNQAAPTSFDPLLDYSQPYFEGASQFSAPSTPPFDPLKDFSQEYFEGANQYTGPQVPTNVPQTPPTPPGDKSKSITDRITEYAADAVVPTIVNAITSPETERVDPTDDLRDLADREAERIRGNTSMVQNAFTGYDDGYYTGIANAYRNYAMPLVEEQAAEARRMMPFGFSDSGGSAFKTKAGQLEREIARNQADVSNTALRHADERRAAVEASKSNLLDLSLAGADTNIVAAEAANRAKQFAAPPPFSPIADLFSKYTADAANYSLARAMLGSPTSMATQSGAPLLFGPRSASQVTIR